MIIDIDRHGGFALREDFLAPYSARHVNWGFGALSWVTFQRTYSRDGEKWWQTCRRVIEGTFTVQRIYCLERGITWDQARAVNLAQEADVRVQVDTPGTGHMDHGHAIYVRTRRSSAKQLWVRIDTKHKRGFL